MIYKYESIKKNISCSSLCSQIVSIVLIPTKWKKQLEHTAKGKEKLSKKSYLKFFLIRCLIESMLIFFSPFPKGPYIPQTDVCILYMFVSYIYICVCVLLKVDSLALIEIGPT